MSGTTPDLTKIFGHYTGQTLLNPRRVSCDVDMVLEDMKATASQHHLDLRVNYPGNCFTMNLKTNRVNVEVQKDGSGVLKVSGFSIG